MGNRSPSVRGCYASESRTQGCNSNRYLSTPSRRHQLKHIISADACARLVEGEEVPRAGRARTEDTGGQPLMERLAHSEVHPPTHRPPHRNRWIWSVLWADTSSWGGHPCVPNEGPPTNTHTYDQVEMREGKLMFTDFRLVQRNGKSNSPPQHHFRRLGHVPLGSRHRTCAQTYNDAELESRTDRVTTGAYSSLAIASSRSALLSLIISRVLHFIWITAPWWAPRRATRFKLRRE